VDCVAEFEPCSLKTMTNALDNNSPGSAHSRPFRRLLRGDLQAVLVKQVPGGPMRLNVDSEQTFLFFRTPRENDSFFVQQLTSAKKIAVTIHLCRATSIESGNLDSFGLNLPGLVTTRSVVMSGIVFVLFLLVTCAYAKAHPVCGDTCGGGTQPRESSVQPQAFLFFPTWTSTAAPAPERGGRESSGSNQSATDPLHPNSSEINAPSGVAE
jgi:hypothetical protein